MRYANGRAETIPVALGRLAKVHSRTGSVPLHAFLVGDTVIVATLINAAVAAAHIPGRPLPLDVPVLTKWRIATVEALTHDVVRVRYSACSPLEVTGAAVAPAELRGSSASASAGQTVRNTPSRLLPPLSAADLDVEDIDMRSHKWRVRPRVLRGVPLPLAITPSTEVASLELELAEREVAAFISALERSGLCVVPIVVSDGSAAGSVPLRLRLPGTPRCRQRSSPGSLFAAIAHQQFGDFSQAPRVREAVCDHMLREPVFARIVEAWARSVVGDEAIEDFEPKDLRVYVDRMRLPTSSGGWIESVAIEEVYDRSLRVWHLESFLHSGKLESRGLTLTSQQSAITPLRLAYLGGGEYFSLVPSPHLLSSASTGRAEHADAVSPPLPLRTTTTIRDARVARGNGIEVLAAATAADRLHEALRTHIRRSSLLPESVPEALLSKPEEALSKGAAQQHSTLADSLTPVSPAPSPASIAVPSTTQTAAAAHSAAA